MRSPQVAAPSSPRLGCAVLQQASGGSSSPRGTAVSRIPPLRIACSRNDVSAADHSMECSLDPLASRPLMPRSPRPASPAASRDGIRFSPRRSPRLVVSARSAGRFAQCSSPSQLRSSQCLRQSPRVPATCAASKLMSPRVSLSAGVWRLGNLQSQASKALAAAAAAETQASAKLSSGTKEPDPDLISIYEGFFIGDPRDDIEELYHVDWTCAAGAAVNITTAAARQGHGDYDTRDANPAMKTRSDNSCCVVPGSPRQPFKDVGNHR